MQPTECEPARCEPHFYDGEGMKSFWSSDNLDSHTYSTTQKFTHKYNHTKNMHPYTLKHTKRYVPANKMRASLFGESLLTSGHSFSKDRNKQGTLRCPKTKHCRRTCIFYGSLSSWANYRTPYKERCCGRNAYKFLIAVAENPLLKTTHEALFTELSKFCAIPLWVERTARDRRETIMIAVKHRMNAV